MSQPVVLKTRLADIIHSLENLTLLFLLFHQHHRSDIRQHDARVHAVYAYR